MATRAALAIAPGVLLAGVAGVFMLLTSLRLSSSRASSLSRCDSYVRTQLGEREQLIVDPGQCGG